MKLNSLIPTFLAATGVTLVANTMPAQAFFDLSSSFVTGFDANIDSQFNIRIQDVVGDGPNSGKVSFTFTNKGNVKSSITDVYFGKSGTINNYFSVPGIINSSTGVSFSQGANPSQPPQSKFGWLAAYTADSDPGLLGLGIVRKGVNNYTGSGVQDFLTFTFDTVNGNNAESIFNAFSKPTGNPDLAIAFQVQETVFTPNKSAWYGSNGVTSEDIPEPLTMLGTTMAFGFAGLCKGEYDKKKKKQKVTT
jgi:hypothetical protein